MVNDITDKKQYVVWYNGGSGGFITSWLIQLCIDPSLLDRAFENFPGKLKTDHLSWQKYEQVPPNVGLLCNSFDPHAYYVDIKDHAKGILNKIISNDSSNIYDLFYCRSKYFLVSHVYQQGNTTIEKYKKYSSNLTYDKTYFKQQTDILFDATKNIFVRAPIEYQKIAQKTKQSRNISFDMESVLIDYPTLKCFNIQSIWQRKYFSELEKVLDQSVNIKSQQVINKLVDHYLNIAPTELRKYCEEQWNI
jgi:hypothetical protein